MLPRKNYATLKARNMSCAVTKYLQLLGQRQLCPTQPPAPHLHVRWVRTPNTSECNLFRMTDLGEISRGTKVVFSDVPGVPLLPIKRSTDCIACRDSVAVLYQILRQDWT